MEIYIPKPCFTNVNAQSFPMACWKILLITNLTLGRWHPPKSISHPPPGANGASVITCATPSVSGVGAFITEIGGSGSISIVAARESEFLFLERCLQDERDLG